MKLKIHIIILIMLLAVTMPLYSEYVFLKDGSIIEGVITSDAAGSVTIRDKDKKIRQIPRTNIMRILYTELYMGKVYVQKIDGKNVICYMVDEDRESYTFRKELFNPEEFKLRRDQVLFMARGNPTGLEGEAEFDRASLKWFPPYNPVKKYRIYIKGPEDKAYRVADETGSKSITIKELKSNTKYLIYVTALDSSGDESVPSNELTLMTKNLAPDKPVITGVDPLPAGGYRISWNPSSDPDGKLAGYRLYRKKNEKTELITELKKNEYILPKNEDIDIVYLTSVDDLKAESVIVKVNDKYPAVMGISINPAYLYPLGKLKDMADYGYGAVIKYEASNYLFAGLELSAEAGFFYLPGVSNFPEAESKINSLMFVPVMFSAGYGFHITDNFTIAPVIAAGGVFLRYDYTYFDIPTSKKTGVSKNQINPAVGGGILIRYLITDTVYVNLSLDYRMFFEQDGNFSFIIASAGAGVRF